jgi:hypothetical protein
MRLLLWLAHKFVDFLIWIVSHADKCIHGKPMCDACKREWHKTRHSAGGW